MAVSYTSASASSWVSVDNAATSSLSPSGSEGVVGVGVIWNGTATITSVKHGSGGSDFSAVSGATADYTTGASMHARGYVRAVGSTTNSVNVVWSAAVTGLVHAICQDGANQTTPAVSGFGASGTQAPVAGSSPATKTLTNSSISCAVGDMVNLFAYYQCANVVSMSGISSTSGTEVNQTGSGFHMGASYYDTCDSTSESANSTGTCPSFYYSGYGYYSPRISGVQVGFVVQQSGGGGTTINATSDSLNLTTYDAVVNASKNITATSDSLTLTEYNADINLNKSISAASDPLILTTYDATITYDVNVTSGVDSLVLTAYDAVVNAAKNITATSDSLALTTYNADVSIDKVINATSDSLTLTPYNVTIQYGGAVNISAGVDNLVLTPYDVIVNAAKNISATSDSLTLTPYDVDVNLNKNIQASADSLVLTAYPATVEYPVNVNIQVSRQQLILTEYPTTVDVPRLSKGGRSKKKDKKSEVPGYLQRILEPAELPAPVIEKTKNPVILPFSRPVPIPPNRVQVEFKTKEKVQSISELVEELKVSVSDLNSKVNQLTKLIEDKDKELEKMFSLLKGEVQDEVIALITAIQ